jgi:hypothetical protein
MKILAICLALLPFTLSSQQNPFVQHFSEADTTLHINRIIETPVGFFCVSSMHLNRTWIPKAAFYQISPDGTIIQSGTFQPPVQTPGVRVFDVFYVQDSLKILLADTRPSSQRQYFHSSINLTSKKESHHEFFFDVSPPDEINPIGIFFQNQLSFTAHGAYAEDFNGTFQHSGFVSYQSFTTGSKTIKPYARANYLLPYQNYNLVIRSVSIGITGFHIFLMDKDTITDQGSRYYDWGFVYSLTKSQDGNALLTGTINYNSAYIFKIDSLGDSLWIRSFVPDSAHLYISRGMKCIVDNNLIHVLWRAERDRPSFRYHRNFLTTLDLNGNVIRQTELFTELDTSANSYIQIHDFIVTTDGGFAFGGVTITWNTPTPGQTHYQPLFAKTDHFGTLTSAKKQEKPSPATLKIYPNPAKDQVRIEVPNDFKGHLRLVDLTGRTVQVMNVSNVVLLQRDGLPKGIYLVEVISGSGERHFGKVVWE